MADFISKMNLFDGEVVGTRDGRVVIRAPLLAGQVGDLPLAFDGDAKGDVGIAIRPEKIRLDLEQPDDQSVRLRARVLEVVYYGNESHVFLESPSGARITANMNNTSRGTHAGIVMDAELWVSWLHEDTLDLRAECE